MSYTPEEVDSLVANLERRIEKLQGTLISAVKRNASERDVLAAAAEIRNLLKKAVADDKTRLSAIFGGECERIGRIRYAFDVVEFSDMHKTDRRWSDLNEASTVIEEVLKALGAYKPWKPDTKAVKNFGLKTIKSLTLDQQVVVKPKIEGEALIFAAEAPSSPGSTPDKTPGTISGMSSGGSSEMTPEKMPETPKRTRAKSSCNDATTMTTPRVMIGATAYFPALLGASLAPAKGVAHLHHKLLEESAVDAAASLGSEIDRGSDTCAVEPFCPAASEVEPENRLWLDAGLTLDPEKGLWVGTDLLPVYLFA